MQKDRLRYNSRHSENNDHERTFTEGQAMPLIISVLQEQIHVCVTLSLHCFKGVCIMLVARNSSIMNDEIICLSQSRLRYGHASSHFAFYPIKSYMRTELLVCTK